MNNLNDGQKKALDLSGNMAVNAGPGTGKTRTLVAKYLKALEATNYRFDRVVAITFTEKAARELMDRIAKEIPKERFIKFITDRRIGTIHSFCSSLLKRRGPDISPAIRILDEKKRSTEWAIIGGGLIGCEVSSDLAVSGDKVSLFHAENRLMERQLVAEDSLKLLAVMQSHSVDVKFQQAIQAIEKTGDQTSYSVLLL